MTRQRAISHLKDISMWGIVKADEYNALKMAIKALEQETKTGHWIWCGSANKCSNCEEYTCLEDNTRNAPKYCPNCGAKMEG